MATATKRKSLPEDNVTSGPPPATKRRKGLEHAPRPEVSQFAHDITTAPQHGKGVSCVTSGSSESDDGSDSLGSTSQSPPSASISSSSESDAGPSREEPESEDDNTSSSFSFSSSSDSASSSDSTNIVTLPISHKPSIMRNPPSDTTSDLHHRLSTFLPNLAAANDELEVERAAGTLGDRNIESVNSGNYIEMNLGLGVLQAKGHPGEGTGSSSGAGSLGGDDASDEEGNGDGGGEQGLQEAQGETDVLGKLLRRKKSKVEIQVIDAG